MLSKVLALPNTDLPVATILIGFLATSFVLKVPPLASFLSFCLGAGEDGRAVVEELAT
jgi:hypothetical protein